jgi:hypothetical protein
MQTYSVEQVFKVQTHEGPEMRVKIALGMQTHGAEVT